MKMEKGDKEVVRVCVYIMLACLIGLGASTPYIQNLWDTTPQSQLPFPSTVVTTTNSPTAIFQYAPLFWANPRAVVTTNNLFAVTSWADSSGNGNTFYPDPTSASPIYNQTGFGGYPCWNVQANWNRATGGSPTVFYAMTNATVWGQVQNTSNFCIVDVFQDTLELGNQFTNNGVELAGPVFLYSVGNNVQLFAQPASGSASGFSGSMLASVCGGSIFPLLRHGYTPNVTVLQVINGVASFWINGVKAVTPVSTQSGAQTSTGTGFTIDNANFGGTLFLSGRPSFCGNQSDFLIFSNAIPDSGVKAISDYLMKANGIRGGTAITFDGDSIFIGAFSKSTASNFLALAQYYNPNTLCSDIAISGANSGQVLGYLTNNGAAQPPTTGNGIIVWLEMVNDVNNSVSLATFETHTTNALNYAHSIGQKFDLCTQFSFAGETGGSFTRAQGNAFIYSLTNNPAPTRPDAIIDFASDPIMGTNGASVQSGTIYFANNIHPNAAGYYQLYTAEMGPVLQAQLSGNGSSYQGTFTGIGTVSATGSFASYGIHTPAALTVGSSPFNYTNLTGTAQECYLTDAAAYAVSKNGASVFSSLAGDCYFTLQPTNYCTVTYSSTTPTMTTNAW
jgi:hypothetical protein